MTDDRDICERLEDTSYDGAFAMRREAAKLIRALRYYADWLEDKLREVGLEAERFREHVAKQQLDIITLGQEVGRLREALRPFDCLKGNWTHQPDDLPLTVAFNSDVRFSLTLGDFRRARAALGEEKKK